MLMVWWQFVKKFETNKLLPQATQNLTRNYNSTKIYTRRNKLNKDLKYMLIWLDAKHALFDFFGQGQRNFIEKNCSSINCYVTDDRNFFNGDTTKFDAIAFDGRTILKMNKSELPTTRSTHQKFIYFSLESADNYPVCSDLFDNFFNWTVTYRLDSDIPYPYIQIRDTHGEIVGPKKDMKWPDMGVLDDTELEMQLQNKSKAVDWFVSNCFARSKRHDYVNELMKALYPFGLTVDIYGQCGPLKCPVEVEGTCSLLKRDYFFYLSFENSMSEDYVTEKLLTALDHNAIPIVFGGADYSRFLPPGSYIDALKIKPKRLAATIFRTMSDTDYHTNFFRWWQHYIYVNPLSTDNVCAVCEALNDERKMGNITTYKNFREWWNPEYTDRC